MYKTYFSEDDIVNSRQITQKVINNDQDVLLENLMGKYNEFPPPVKSTNIPDLNLTQRLFPLPTFTSA